MEMLKKLSLNAKLVLLGSIFYVIASFLNWQSYHGLVTANEWNGGLGVIAGLLVLVLISWEVARGFDLKIATASASPSLISIVLAGALLLFTVIKFLDVSYRAYGAWLGLIFAIVVGVFAFLRAKEEGVQMPSAVGSGTAA